MDSAGFVASHPGLFKLETNPVANGNAPGNVGVLRIGNLRRFYAGSTQLCDTNPQITALSARSFLGLNGPRKAHLHFTGITVIRAYVLPSLRWRTLMLAMLPFYPQILTGVLTAGFCVRSIVPMSCRFME